MGVGREDYRESLIHVAWGAVADLHCIYLLTGLSCCTVMVVGSNPKALIGAAFECSYLPHCTVGC